MRIKNLIIVEFSETGNACYIYDAEMYKNEKINSALLTLKSREETTVSNFKNKNIALDIIKHNPSLNNDKDWQESMKKALTKYLKNN